MASMAGAQGRFPGLWHSCAGSSLFPYKQHDNGPEGPMHVCPCSPALRGAHRFKMTSGANVPKPGQSWSCPCPPRSMRCGLQDIGLSGCAPSLQALSATIRAAAPSWRLEGPDSPSRHPFLGKPSLPPISLARGSWSPGPPAPAAECPLLRLQSGPRVSMGGRVVKCAAQLCPGQPIWSRCLGDASRSTYEILICDCVRRNPQTAS